MNEMESYIDEEGKIHPHIFLKMDAYNGYLPGYYFEDEVSQLSGPYGTLEECEDSFKRYCEEYLS